MFNPKMDLRMERGRSKRVLNKQEEKRIKSEPKLD